MEFKKVDDLYLTKPPLFEYLVDIGALNDIDDLTQKLRLANVLNDTIMFGAEMVDKTFDPTQTKNHEIIQSLLTDLPIIMRKLFIQTNGRVTDYYDVWLSYENFWAEEHKKYFDLEILKKDTIWALMISDFIDGYITKRALPTEDDEI
jgi:hypothetical protein